MFTPLDPEPYGNFWYPGSKKKIIDADPQHQCCGADGAEIIWGPGAGAENKFS